MSKKIVPINYLNRDFTSIKDALIDHAKRYYPDTYKDFNEASFGSLMLDAVSYVGDVLSYYLDYQTNESYLDTAIEYNNVVRLARQMGYKYTRAASTSGTVTLFIKVPRKSVGEGPDEDLIPTIEAGTAFESQSGVNFSLIQDVDFSDPTVETVVATVDPTTNEPLTYALKAYGEVICGELVEEVAEVGAFQRLLQIVLNSSFVTEIISVTDSEGHEYFEVDNLSQDVVYRQIRNRKDSSASAPKYIIKPVSVQRRFTFEQDQNISYLQFGYGSDNSLSDSPLAKVSDIVLKKYAKNYITDTNYDPSRLNKNDKLGVGPSDTTLTILLRRVERLYNGAAAGTITTVSDSIMGFPESSKTSSDRLDVRESLEVLNEEPLVGDADEMSADAVRQRAIGSMATQDRAVTRSDYKYVTYRMPPQFGKISRCSAVRDPDSLKRNINLYVSSLDTNGVLVPTNTVIKENLKTWLTGYKMVNDTIDILDARIINFAIDFTVLKGDAANSVVVYDGIMAALRRYFEIIQLDVGEPLYISDLFTTISAVAGIIDVSKIDVVPKFGNDYSSVTIDFNKYKSPDGRILYVPEDAILELKFPNTDIVGTIK